MAYGLVGNVRIGAGTRIEGNAATSHGGAFFMSSSTLTIEGPDVVISDNSVPLGSEYGGCIYLGGSTVALLTNLEFVRSSAALGGAVYTDSGSTVIAHNVSAVDTVADGSVYLEGQITITNLTCIGAAEPTATAGPRINGANVAVCDGIYVVNPVGSTAGLSLSLTSGAAVVNVVVENPRCDGIVAGLWAVFANVVAVTIRSPVATAGEAGAYLDSTVASGVTVLDAVSVSGIAGVLSFDGTVASVRVERAQHPNGYAGVDISGSVTGVTVVDCTGQTAGIFCSDTPTVVTNAIVTDNTADNGAGIYVYPGESVTVSGSVIRSNS